MTAQSNEEKERRRELMRAAVTPRGISGYVTIGGRRKFPGEDPGSIVDWGMWQSMATVELWEALVLSVGRDPSHPPPPSSNDPINKDYERRLRVAESHLQPGGTLQLAPHARGNPAPRVSLTEFAEWALSLGWQLPDAFRAKPEPPLAVPEAAELVPTKPRNSPRPRLTWRDVAKPYMLEVLRSGKFASAAEFERELRKGAGSLGSPFEKGTDVHRGTLWVRELGKPLSLKAIQNNWSKLKQEALA